MNHRFSRFAALVAAFFALLQIQTSAAASLTADSAIRGVTVYHDRAVVTRQASFDLSAGMVDVVFEKLPGGLMTESLQVSGQGTAQVTILEVTPRQIFVDTTPNDRARVLETQLRAFGKDRRSLEDRAKLLETQRASVDFAESALLASNGKETARPTIAEATTVLSFTHEQRTRIAAEIAALDEQRFDLGAKIVAVENQLKEVQRPLRNVTSAVTIRLEVSTSGKFDLVLGYAVPNASWAPHYDARANSTAATVALGYYAVVAQNTGEEWKNVALTLSSAQPSRGGAAPELPAWDLKLGNRMPVRPDPASTILGFSAGNLAPLGAGTPMTNDGFAAGEAIPKLARAAQATMEQATTSASFKIVTPVTVPSDGSAQKFPITSLALAANLEYATTPKLRTAAFLTAKVVNSSDYPLLAGPMNVFLDGTFVATSALDSVMGGEKFVLALGADEGIAVKHKRLQRFTENTGLTGGGRRITYEYRLTLQNNKKTPVQVVVSDQIPVSFHEKIVVRQLAPDAKDNKPVEGILKWTLDLKPGEKRELPLKFTIDYPGDTPVTGLEM
jgi:uncharacterized protein (TIGR02231 family)